MNRVEALATAVNDTSRPEAEREIATRALIDIASTSADSVERAFASKALDEFRPLSVHDCVDRELERWLTRGKLSTRETSELFASFSKESQQFIDDFLFALICGPPAPNAVERLTALIARTHSAIVKPRAENALRGTLHYLEHEEEIRAAIESVPKHLR